MLLWFIWGALRKWSHLHCTMPTMGTVSFISYWCLTEEFCKTLANVDFLGSSWDWGKLSLISKYLLYYTILEQYFDSSWGVWVNLNMKTARKPLSPTHHCKFIEMTSEVRKDLKTYEIHTLLFVTTSERNEFHWWSSAEFIFSAFHREDKEVTKSLYSIS